MLEGRGCRGFLCANAVLLPLLPAAASTGTPAHLLQVGISPVCILGVNINRGQEISLRLRTDDLKGALAAGEAARNIAVVSLPAVLTEGAACCGLPPVRSHPGDAAARVGTHDVGK